MSRGDEVGHGVGSEFGDGLLCRHRKRDAQGQTQLDRIPQKYQEVRALRIRAGGARGDAKALAMERMGRVVNSHDL